jgi:hypothetical protein
MLDGLVYDPEQRPEAQHHLRAIPPSSRVDHPMLNTALVEYEKARAAEHEGRLAHVQAEQEVPAAEWKDEEALADALAAGRKDPGPKHADAHRLVVQEAKRRHGAAKITLQRAVENVSNVFGQHGDEWQQTLESERDAVREQLGRAIDEVTEQWTALQLNASNRALMSSQGGAQDPSVYAASFRAPMVRDGNVVQVADVLEGLRQLAAPEKPNPGSVENAEVGAEPSRHAPPRRPFAGMGGSSQSLGPVRDPEKVLAWVEKDEAEALERAAALSEGQRNERMARADSRRAEREEIKAVEREAVDATR